ncbi:creatininase family protein [Micromonospora sp. C95]|uniref:creatininase family protein n=1 Tax=Micromonospora sp. C95 TaxID=2824882 RepID=UPI001B380AD8|nr:creatininase family protein [Micromonospora sp. C95]MBQ1026036.1 creatininase family protein [Micromonospora sp. C95]
MDAGRLTTTDVAGAFRDGDPTAVLVTGACEQHGPHLPLDTDRFLAERVAVAACSSSGDHVLPALPFGYNEKELSFPGTVSVPATTYLDLLVGVGRSVRRSGWSRLVIVNGHGWNNDLVRAATHVLNEDPTFRVACCSYWNLCLSEVRELRESPTPGGMAHGCEFETSLMLHLRPESVRTELIEDEISYRRLPGLHHDLVEKSPMFMPEVFDQLSMSGVIGSPSLATAEKGRVWFDAAAERLSSFLLGFRAAFPRKDAL